MIQKWFSLVLCAQWSVSFSADGEGDFPLLVIGSSLGISLLDSYNSWEAEHSFSKSKEKWLVE